VRLGHSHNTQVPMIGPIDKIPYKDKWGNRKKKKLSDSSFIQIVLYNASMLTTKIQGNTTI